MHQNRNKSKPFQNVQTFGTWPFSPLPPKTYLSSTMHNPTLAHSYLPSLNSSLARLIKNASCRASCIVHRPFTAETHPSTAEKPPVRRGATFHHDMCLSNHNLQHACDTRERKPSSYLSCVCDSRSGLDVKENPV